MRSSERRWVGSQPHAVTQPEARTVACSQGKRVPGSWSRAQKPRQEGRHQRRTKPACGDGAAGPPPPAAREGPLATRGWWRRQRNWKPGARDPRGGTRGGPGQCCAAAARREERDVSGPSQPSQRSRGSPWPVGCRHGQSPQGLGSGLPRELPMGPRAACGAVWALGRPGERGRCLQGFPSGLRRLLHRLHEEAPAWGCPGAGRSL